MHHIQCTLESRQKNEVNESSIMCHTLVPNKRARVQRVPEPLLQYWCPHRQHVRWDVGIRGECWVRNCFVFVRCQFLLLPSRFRAQAFRYQFILLSSMEFATTAHCVIKGGRGPVGCSERWWCFIVQARASAKDDAFQVVFGCVYVLILQNYTASECARTSG